MKSLLGLVQSQPCRVDIEFREADGKPKKHTITVKTKKEDTEEVPVYTNKDTLMGEIRLTPLTTKKLEHQGIKVQLLGQIELASERGTVHEFVSLVRELAPPGDLNSAKVFPFEFRNVELQYDSYRGQQVRCRYLLRVTVTGKGMTQDSKREFNIWVINYEPTNEAGPPIKMEVGIEDCLHIEFEYDRARYHLRDVVVGRIYFLLVRIKLKHMEIEIRRKETTGAGTAAHSESETLAKYEIMDGAPVRGESVPIRLYLSPYELAPTYKDVHNKFSVRYFLNLVLVDEEDRRYFKQQEITLFRKAPDTEAEIAAHSHAGPPKLASINYRAPILSPNGSTSGAAASSSAAAAAAAQQPELTQPPPPILSPAPVPAAAAVSSSSAAPVPVPLPVSTGPSAAPAAAPVQAAQAVAVPASSSMMDGPLSSSSQGAPAAAAAAAVAAPPPSSSGGDANGALLQASKPVPTAAAASDDLLGGEGLTSSSAAPSAAADGVAAAGGAVGGLTFGDGDSKQEGIL